MGIEEMFRLADEQSTSIQSHRTEKYAAGKALETAKARRLPDIGISLSASYLGNGKIWNRDFTDGSTVPMPHFSANFALEARQVIYDGGNINSGIRQAELEELLAELNLQKNIQDVRFLLVGEYLDLYKLDNQISVLRNNLELTEQIITNMKARREQGTVLKNDITRYELQKERLILQLSEIQDARKIANHRLTTALHLPDDTQIYPDTTLLNEKVSILTESKWLETACAHHISLKQTQTAIRINEQKVREERSERIPHIDIIAANHLDGPVTIEVPALNNYFNYWYVGVGISYNLSSLFKNKKKVQQARLNVQQTRELHQLTQEQVKNDIQESYVKFQTAFTDLHTQENSVKLANENYAVVSQRYQNDMALLTDLLDASNMKLAAELDLVNARINIIYCSFRMKYVTHTL